MSSLNIPFDTGQGQRQQQVPVHNLPVRFVLQQHEVIVCKE